VLRALGLGDLLTAVPALRALAAAFPDHRRVLAAPVALAPVVELLGGAIDELVDLPAHVGGDRGTRPDPAHAALLPARPAVAVNLHGRGPHSTRLLAATGPGRLIAFDLPAAGIESPRVDEPARLDDPARAGRARAVPPPRWRDGEREVVRWCRLLRANGIPADPGALDHPRPRPPIPALATVLADATLLHPGAASPARRWPLERWVAVARAERSGGRCVVVSGSAAERPLAVELAHGAGLRRAAVLAGRTDLRQLLRLVAHAGRVVCGDTGVAHLATAFGTPSVVLFGPTSPAVWGPPPERGQHRVLWAGRSGDPHAERPDPGLLEIDADAVLAALAALPDRVEERRPVAAR
jgi:ADP-heptose:LPS heptosyltransferase